VVNRVTITPGEVTVTRGDSQEFTALVEGSEGVSQEVDWTLEEGHVAGTTLTPDPDVPTKAVLYVAADETAVTLTVTAASKANPSKSGTAAVTVTPGVPQALPAPQNLRWSGNTAQWDPVTGAAGYSVQLYKNETPEGDPVELAGTSHDFSGSVEDTGVYTFTVTAKGDEAAFFLDSAAADSTGTEDGGGRLAVGTKVSVIFTPDDESGNLTVMAPEVLTISKTSETATLDLTVEGDGFNGFIWVLDGVPIDASGNGITLGSGGTTLTINAADSSVRLGGHSVTVYAWRAGVLWSPRSAVSLNVTQ
jgi:hypothetical protein